MVLHGDFRRGTELLVVLCGEVYCGTAGKETMVFLLDTAAGFLQLFLIAFLILTLIQ